MAGIKKEIAFLPVRTSCIGFFATLHIRSHATGGKMNLSTDGICTACYGCSPAIRPSGVPASEVVQDLLTICISVPISIASLLSLKQFCYTTCYSAFLTEIQKEPGTISLSDLTSLPVPPGAEQEWKRGKEGLRGKQRSTERKRGMRSQTDSGGVEKTDGGGQTDG